MKTPRTFLIAFLGAAAAILFPASVFAAVVLQDETFVMPSEYTYVIGAGDTSAYGLPECNKINVWGRMSWAAFDTIKTWTGDYRFAYRWEFYGTSAQPTRTWSTDRIYIEGTNYDYMKDEGLTATGGSFGVNAFPAPPDGGAPFAVYTPRLVIEQNSPLTGWSERASVTLPVKSFNFNNITAAVAAEAGLTVDQYKRTVLESIARGRALTWLYYRGCEGRNPERTRAHWHVSTTEDLFVPPTALALSAFLINGHSVFVSSAPKSAFSEIVDQGFNYLFYKTAVTDVNYTNLDAYPSDINGNTKQAHCGDNESLQDGTVLLALSAAYGSLRQSNNLDKNISGLIGSGAPNGYTFRNLVADTVDNASWAQGDLDGGMGNRIIGGGQWREGANSSEYDAWNMQWPVLGLDAVEETWGFRAHDFVRNRMLNVIRSAQFQYPGIASAANWLPYYDGGAVFAGVHMPQTSYYSPVGVESPFNVIPSSFTEYKYDLSEGVKDPGTMISADQKNMMGRWTEGTSSLLQMMYYVSRDTWTAAPALRVCGCGALLCNDSATDFRISTSAVLNSWSPGACFRVKRAIDFIGRAWQYVFYPYSTDSNGRGNLSLSTMYFTMKAMRFYNIVPAETGHPAGINSGVVYEGANFSPSGTAHNWESEISNFIFQHQSYDAGRHIWRWDDKFSGDPDFGAAYVALILGELRLRAPRLRTDLPASFDERISIQLAKRNSP